MSLIAAAVQFKPRMATCRADVQDNLRRTEDLTHAAWDVGANLVVFPELFATGYSFLGMDDAIPVAEPAADGVTARHMRGVASSLKAYVVWGFVELADGALHNSVSVADPSGTIVLTNRKMNLWGNDYLWAKPGPEIPAVLETDFGIMTAVVCRDLRGKRPTKLPRVATEGKPMLPSPVDLVAAPVNWGKGGFPAVAWMDFVSDNNCTLVVANRWGREANGGFEQDFGLGGSLIADPFWNVHMGGLKFGADCVVSARLEVLRG